MSRRGRKGAGGGSSAPAAAGAPAAARSGKKLLGIKTDWLVRLVEMGIVAFATVTLSILIQKVSGPALWLPGEWRSLLLVVVPLLCTAVLVPTIRVLIAAALPGAAEHGGAHGAEDGRAGRLRRAKRDRLVCHLAALAFAVLAVFAVMRLLTLRGESVRTFQPAVNLASEFAGVRPPFFVDLKESQILTPREGAWPAEMTAYFRAIERDRGVPDGLAWLLDYAPYEVVQRLQSSPGKEALQATVWAFVTWYLVFVTSLTAALVFAMNPKEFFIEELLGRVLGH